MISEVKRSHRHLVWIDLILCQCWHNNRIESPDFGVCVVHIVCWSLNFWIIWKGKAIIEHINQTRDRQNKAKRKEGTFIRRFVVIISPNNWLELCGYNRNTDERCLIYGWELDVLPSHVIVITLPHQIFIRQ